MCIGAIRSLASQAGQSGWAHMKSELQHAQPALVDEDARSERA